MGDDFKWKTSQNKWTNYSKALIANELDHPVFNAQFIVNKWGWYSIINNILTDRNETKKIFV